MTNKRQNEEPEEPENQEEEAQLTAAFEGILQARRTSRSKGKAEAAIRQLQESLSLLDDESFRQLVARDDVQDILNRSMSAKSLKPGDAIVDDKGREIGRVAYTEQWLTDNMPEVEWVVPHEPFGRPTWNSVSWNGVQCPQKLVVGETVKTLCCFRDIVQEAAGTIRNALNNQAYVLAATGAAHGSSVEAVGWAKPSEAELVASGEWRERR